MHLPSSSGIPGGSCRVQHLWEMACFGEAKLRDTSNPTVLEATEGGEKSSLTSSASVSRIPSLGSNQESSQHSWGSKQLALVSREKRTGQR